MSLLNQVLNDLEQRRAEAGGHRLPRDVRPLPVAAPSRRPLIAGLVVLLGVLVAGVFAWQVMGPGRPLPEVNSLPVQTVINTTLPPLALAPQVPAPQPASPVATAPAVVPPAPVPSSASEPEAVAPVRKVPPLPALKLSGQLSRLPAEPAAPSSRAAAVDSPLAEDPAGSIEKSPVDEAPKAKAERLYRSALGLINQGRSDDGLTALRAALREDVAHVPARQILLKLYLDSRSWDAAQGVLRDGLDHLPQQSAWAMLLARLLADRGDNAGALQVLEKHEPGAQANADYQGALGAILQRLSRDAEAEQRYERSVKVEPGNGRWWIGLAIAREAQGKAAEAREAFQRAMAARTLPPDLQAYAEGKLK